MVVLIFGTDSSDEVPFEKNPMCDPEICFAPLHDCTKEKEDKSRIYIYNAKTFKCETSKKCGPVEEFNGERMFSTISNCETICQFCPTVLKHYKPDDPCLLYDLKIQDGEDETKPAKLTKYWIFTLSNGTCKAIESEVRPGFKATKGLIFMSEKECHKRCPDIP